MSTATFLNSMVTGFIVVGAMELGLLAMKDTHRKIKRGQYKKTLARSIIVCILFAEAVVFYQGIKLMRISETPEFINMTMTVDK